MFLNTARGEVFPGLTDGLVVIPCYYNRTFIEWKIREAGGVFVADHGIDGGAARLPTCHRDDKGRDILPNGNQLVQTAQYYMLLCTEDGWKPFFFQAEDGIRDLYVTGVQTCALPI